MNETSYLPNGYAILPAGEHLFYVVFARLFNKNLILEEKRGKLSRVDVERDEQGNYREFEKYEDARLYIWKKVNPEYFDEMV